MKVLVKSKVAALPIRSKPSEAAEMVSQLLFGETAEVIEEDKSWTRVRCSHDGYQGWVDSLCLASISTTPDAKYTSFVCSAVAYLSNSSETFRIPFGSPVTLVDDASISIDGKLWDYDGDASAPLSTNNFGEDLSSMIDELMNTPYLWGGRSTFGIDCSGLCQIVFRLFGIELPRDSSAQAKEGEDVDFDDLRCGDLVFLDKTNKKISHVGIYLGEGRIAHASGWVKIEKLEKEGIINAESGAVSHRYILAKRMLEL